MICFRFILQKRDDLDVNTMAMPHVTLIDVFLIQLSCEGKFRVN